MASPLQQPDSSQRQRRIQFKDYGSWRANLLLWGVPIAAVVFILFANFNSSSSTSVSGIPFDITCDGWSADPASGQCPAWAQEVVDSGIPEAENDVDVTELQLKKAWYGFVDDCTAVFIFEDGTTAERDVPCP
jgi:hypothetical protein